MQKLLIKNANVILEDKIVKQDLFVCEGKIVDPACDTIPDEIFDAENKYLAPGFIDLHIHGGGGADFIDGTVEAYECVVKTHLKHGTTTFLPTLTTAPESEIIKSLSAYNEALNTELEPFFAGVHMECPYFSAGEKGAQDIRYFAKIKDRAYVKFYSICKHIKRWSLSPELKDTEELANFCNERDIILSVAHTDALYEDIVRARKMHFTMFTHLYSGMKSVTRINCFRYGGAVEAAYLFDDMFTESIADLRHLPKELIYLIYKIKTADKNILITDAMRAAGQNDVTESYLGSMTCGQKVIIEDGVAKLSDRSCFAGSIATADELIKNTVYAGVSLIDAVKMMTLTPAKILKNDYIGRIGSGCWADFVLLDSELNVCNVFKRGKKLI